MINNECKVQYVKYQYNYILLNLQLHTILRKFFAIQSKIIPRLNSTHCS